MSKARKNHVRPVFAILAAIIGATLLGVFIAPFYGGLERRVAIVESGDPLVETTNRSAGQPSSGNGIVVEQFDYTEPDNEAAVSASDPQVEVEPSKTQQDVFEREPPRPPLSENGLARSPEPVELPKAVTVNSDEPMRLLQRPVAIAAGRIETRGRIIELEGIDVLPSEAVCKVDTGDSWPCGMYARTAFRQWLRSRAIMCRLPDDETSNMVQTQCKVGNEDAAAWLVSQGWAKALTDGAYRQQGEKAEDEKLGVFGVKPETTVPEFGQSDPLQLGTEPQGQQDFPDGSSSEPDPSPVLNGQFPPAPVETQPQ